MAYLAINTPHEEVFVKKEYLYDLEKGHGELTPGVWVSAKSIMGRALYFETFLPEYGALFDKLPISAFVWKKDYEGNMPLTELQLWDCFSYDITIIQKVLLGGSMCKYMSPEKQWFKGTNEILLVDLISSDDTAGYLLPYLSGDISTDIMSNDVIRSYR